MKIFIALLLLSITQLDACTGMKLTAKDGSIVNGRTLEFGVPISISIAVVPRGYRFTGTTPQGKGLVYTAKYGVVGAFALGDPLILDGVNEKGLSVGTFYFSGYAKYGDITSENQSSALSPLDFPNWIITQFASIDEVRAALSNVLIAPTSSPSWGNKTPPFHYIVYDRSGKCLVIEPVDGKLITYDNPLGAFTNSPTFDWHVANLRNYINLQAENIDPVKLGTVELAPFGQGSGMLGLPGDFTPPSRFVRAALFSSLGNTCRQRRESYFADLPYFTSV